MQRFDDIYEQLDELASVKPFDHVSTHGGRVVRTRGTARRVWRAVINSEAESRDANLRVMRELFDVTNDMVASLLGVAPIDMTRAPVHAAPDAAATVRGGSGADVGAMVAYDAPSGADAPDEADLTVSRMATHRVVKLSQERFFDTCGAERRQRLETLRDKLAGARKGIVQLAASTYRDDAPTVARLLALHNYVNMQTARIGRALLADGAASSAE